MIFSINKSTKQAVNLIINTTLYLQFGFLVTCFGLQAFLHKYFQLNVKVRTKTYTSTVRTRNLQYLLHFSILTKTLQWLLNCCVFSLNLHLL